MKRITACTYDCPDACSLVAERAADGSIALRGNPESPFTRGFMCAKTRGQHRRLVSPSRITTPLLKSRGGWQAIGWEAALDLCAEKIQALRAEPTAILHIHSDGAKGILKEAVNLFFAQLGSSRIMGSLCDAAGYIAGVEDFGSRENPDIEGLADAAVIVNWGKDFSRSSVHAAAALRQARKRGARVIAVSPAGDGFEGFCDRHILIRPGTDRLLAAALIRRLVSKRRPAPELLACTHQPERFFEMIRGQSTEGLLAACDVSAAGFDLLYEAYTATRPVATFIGAGLQRYRRGGENVRFINALALLSGNVGIPGGGVYFHLHSFRNLELGWIKGPGHKGRRGFPIATIGRGILEAADPPVRLVWVNGINVVNQAPDARETARAFAQVPFKVVVDAFMNDTAERADLVLPCALMLEQEDVIGSFLHEYVQYVDAVCAPPPEARTDLWIVTELGRRLTPQVVMPDAEACLRAALRTPHLDTTLEELREKRFVRSKRPRVAYAGLVFHHPDGKYRFPAVLHPEPPPPEGYPLRLLTLVRRGAIHSQILPEEQAAPPPVWVSPESPGLVGLDLSRPVALVSPLDRLPVTLRLEPGLHPAAVVYRRGDWMNRGGGANRLIASGLTDIGGGAPFYEQYVRLENIPPLPLREGPGDSVSGGDHGGG
ncbi:MAG: molybdopterin-dependent oxidoreductase [Desulfobacterales bacterium]|nr:molybdopterin-dependent oxidoreductase [Desulfobacterales bacterium]